MNERERWEGLADALAADEPLSASDRRFVEGWSDPWVDEERVLYEQLAAAGRAGPLDPGDRQRAEATLAAFNQAKPATRSRGWAWGASATLLAVAAAVLLWWAWPAPDSVLAPQAVIDSGTLMVDGVALGPGDPVPVDRWVVARTRTCVRAGQGQGCASAQARLRIRSEGIELADGTLTYEGTGTVQTPLGTIASEEGAFDLTLLDEALHLEARSGSVQLRDDDGTTETLEPGGVSTRSAASTLARGDDPSASVEPSADDEGEATSSGPARRSSRSRSAAPSASDLLGAARRQAASGDPGRALATYASLRRQHAGSPEAHAANVSIGELELRRGRAKAALRAFARYLSQGGGVLAEEAHWGKIRALHRLGQTEDRDQAIAALRRHYPASVYLARASSL